MRKTDSANSDGTQDHVAEAKFGRRHTSNLAKPKP